MTDNAIVYNSVVKLCDDVHWTELDFQMCDVHRSAKKSERNFSAVGVAVTTSSTVVAAATGWLAGWLMLLFKSKTFAECAKQFPSDKFDEYI